MAIVCLFTALCIGTTSAASVTTIGCVAVAMGLLFVAVFGFAVVFGLPIGAVLGFPFVVISLLVSFIVILFATVSCIYMSLLLHGSVKQPLRQSTYAMSTRSQKKSVSANDSF